VRDGKGCGILNFYTAGAFNVEIPQKN